MQVTGPNGKSIFLPAGGWYDKTTLNNKITYGSYWTATGDGGTAKPWTLLITTRLSSLAAMAGPYALSRTNPNHLKLQPAVHSAGCCLFE